MDMTLNESMKRFREASREIFNRYFRIPQPYANDGWKSEEQFSLLEEHLFRALVLDPTAIGGEEVKYGYVQARIALRLRSALSGSAKAMINREIDSGYWDHQVETIDGEASLLFIRFFDWDVLDYRDNEYVRAQISEWPGHAELIGKHVLIASKDVEYELAPGTKQDAGARAPPK
jgi:hypothetical protein